MSRELSSGEALGKRLWKIAVERGFTQQSDFAKTIELSPAACSMIISGDRPITRQVARLIEIIHNANLDWLETGEGDMFLSGVARKNLPADIVAYLEKAEYVLTSGTSYVSALKENLDAFQHAAEQERAVALRTQKDEETEHRIEELERMMESLLKEKDAYVDAYEKLKIDHKELRKELLQNKLEPNNSEDCGVEVGLPSTSENEKAT